MRTTLLLLFCCWSISLSGQNTDSLTQDRKASIFGLPIVYVTPETSWAFGLAGIYSLYTDRRAPVSGTRPTQLQLAFAYTLKKQILFYLPYEVFTAGNKYRFNGEIGFYRYTYFYYGIGNGAINYPGELFGISFIRTRINALRKTAGPFYLGLRYWMEKFTIDEVAENGLLTDPSIAGSKGGLVSGIGPMFQLDSRDNLFFPRKGALVEAAFLLNGALTGSDYAYTKFSLNASKYWEPVPNTVLALNTYLEFNKGTIPFNQLALLGGGKKLRGYYEGRYRDNHLLIFQGEWRFPVWKRFKGTIFGGTGLVADKIRHFSTQDIRPAYGLGLRYLALKKQQIHVRLDIAWGEKENSGFYLTIGEAF
jgi:outer membrane protein assembly factor BamA